MPKLLSLVAIATLASTGAQGAVSWNVSVSAPAAAPVLVYSQPHAQHRVHTVSQPQYVYQNTVVVDAPVAPVASFTAQAGEQPSALTIENMQAAQQGRIQWGVQVGLITPHEHARLQQTQHYIEEQRRWAYADGWLTYDEYVNLIHLLNGASQEIERKLANWQRVQNAYYPMPPALTVWTIPSQTYYGQHGHGGHPGNGHGNQSHQGHGGHQGHQGKAAQWVIPAPPLPPSPNKLLRNIREHLENARY